MRVLLLRGLAAFLFVLLVSDGANARRSSRPTPTGPLKTVVIPFEAEGALRYELPQALELELELQETVLVMANARTWAEMRKQGSKKFDRKRLQKVMQRRGVDVLVRGVKGFDEYGDTVLHIILYANDGLPRFQGAVASSTDIDNLARKIGELVSEPLAKFAKSGAVALSFPDGKTKKPKKEADDAALFVDVGGDDANDSKRKSKPAKPAPDKRDSVYDRVSDDDDDVEEKPRRRRMLDPDDADEDDRNARSSGNSDRASRDDDGKNGDDGRNKRLSFDDDKNTRRDDDDGSSRRRTRERATMADVVDGEAAPSATDKALTHIFSASVGGGVATWYYDFAATKPIQSNGFSALAFPGASLRLDLWPIEWVGVDVDAHIQAVQFNVDDANAPIVPQQFSAYRYGASVGAKGRYVLKLGTFAVGGGGRVGYRLLGVAADKQTHSVDDELYTIVPGYMFHTVFVGVEGYGAAVFFERRLELELKVDGLPLTRYAETPDNPGAESLAFGWATSATVRMEILFGAFVEGYFFHSGGFALFDGIGDRRGALIDANTGERERIQGGRVMTIDATGGVAVGWMW